VKTELKQEVAGIFGLLEQYHAEGKRKERVSKEAVKHRKFDIIVIICLVLFSIIALIIYYTPSSFWASLPKPLIILHSLSLLAY